MSKRLGLEIIRWGFCGGGMEEFLFGDTILGAGYHGVGIGG